MLDEIKSLINQGNNTEARQLLKKYLRANPDDADAWFLAARVSSTKEQAISCLKKVIDLDPFNDLAVQQYNRLTKTDNVVPKKKNEKQSINNILANPMYIGGGVIALLLFGLFGGVLLSNSNNNESSALLPTMAQDIQSDVNDSSQDTTSLRPTLPPTWTPTPTKRVSPTPRATRETRGTRDNPYPFNDGYVYGIRGGEGLISVVTMEYDAWDLIESINMFNKEPSYNEQWILVGIVYKCDLPSSQTCDISTSFDFELLGSDGTLYEPPFATVLDSLEIQDTVFGGETVSGYIGFIVDKFDSGFILIAKPNMFSDERTFFRTE